MGLILGFVVLPVGAATSAQLIKAEPPVYPEGARQAGVTSWVRVSYRIMEAGAVVDAEVVENCVWKVPRYTSRECADKPDTRFDQAALGAVYRHREKLSGWVTLRFTVTKEGKVQEVEVTGNCATTVPLSKRPCRNKPNDAFDAAATKAVLRWQYQPRIFGGKAVDVAGVVHTMTFDLGH